MKLRFQVIGGRGKHGSKMFYVSDLGNSIDEWKSIIRAKYATGRIKVWDVSTLKVFISRRDQEDSIFLADEDLRASTASIILM